MRRRDLLSLLAVAGAQPLFPRAARGAQRSASLQGSSMSNEDLDRLLRLAAVPSVALAEVDGERVVTMVRGVTRAGDGAPITADTIYAAASLSKFVFSWCFIGLAQEGLLSLDRPVGEYLPLPNADDARARTITARHLLSHTGGWRNWRNNATQPFLADFEPGVRWSYSGEGFFFLQRVVEQLTGKAFPQVVRERVLAPLGMARSSFIAPPEFEPHQASPHNSRGEPTTPFGRPALLEMRRITTAAGRTLDSITVAESEQALRAAEPALPVLPNFLTPNAAASLVTTPADFARFLGHVVNARRSGGAPARIVEQLMTPRVRCNDAIEWGHGVGIETQGDTRWAWQWGDNPGFKNIVFADPERGRAVVVFTNGDRGARVYERVLRARTGIDHPAFLFA